MSSIKFVKIRNDKGEYYQSYDIFYRLIDWNFEWCELDKVDKDSNETYIFTVNNGNVKACCERLHTAKYILWQLEITYEPCPSYFDEQWVSDRTMKGKFVVLGGDARLFFEPSPNKRWDFCHLAYLYGKRAQQVAELESQGFTMAPVGFGEVRDHSIAISRWGLCLHQLDKPILSPQRMTLFACRKLPIVLERSDNYPYDVCFLDEFYRQSWPDNNFRRFTEELTFKRCVEEAL